MNYTNDSTNIAIIQTNSITCPTKYTRQRKYYIALKKISSYRVTKFTTSGSIVSSNRHFEYTHALKNTVPHRIPSSLTQRTETSAKESPLKQISTEISSEVRTSASFQSGGEKSKRKHGVERRKGGGMDRNERKEVRILLSGRGV